MDSVNWLLATGNKGKIRELRRLLKDFPIELTGLEAAGIHADCSESGDSFLENAKQKATFYFQKSSMPTLADDSGLEVDHLAGRPGIYSARFGGLPSHAEKSEYLLSLMKDVPPAYRTARFYCAAVFFNGQTYFTSEGTIEGFIKPAPQGTGGFGYDPIFAPTWDGPTLAEMDLSLKNTISHRGKAFLGLVGHLRSEGLLPDLVST